MENLWQTLQTFEALKNTAGLDIPKLLRSVATGGLVGKAAPEEEKETPSPENKE